MRIDFKKESLPKIKSTKYNYVLNGKKCSFMIDDTYLSNHNDNKTIVLCPTINSSSDASYYTFCLNIIRELVYKISRKEIEPLDTISVEVTDNYSTFFILNS